MYVEVRAEAVCGCRPTAAVEVAHDTVNGVVGVYGADHVERGVFWIALGIYQLFVRCPVLDDRVVEIGDHPQASRWVRDADRNTCSNFCGVDTGRRAVVGEA